MYTHNERVVKITEEIIKVTYPEELANVILDDIKLPAYENAQKIALHAINVMGVQELQDRVQTLQQKNYDLEQEVERAAWDVQRAQDEVRDIRRVARMRAEIQERGDTFMTFRDAEIMRDTEWFEMDQYELYDTYFAVEDDDG